MILYHGSIEEVEKPQILENQRLLDFGRGFYTTSNRIQADRWATIKSRREKLKKSIVNEYIFDDRTFVSGKFKVKTFTEAREEWLDFVYKNRTHYQESMYDIISGPVANDTLYATLTLFETGLLTKEETIKRLKVHHLFDQISFHTSEVLEELQFVKSYTV